MKKGWIYLVGTLEYTRQSYKLNCLKNREKSWVHGVDPKDKSWQWYDFNWLKNSEKKQGLWGGYFEYIMAKLRFQLAEKWWKKAGVMGRITQKESRQSYDFNWLKKREKKLSSWGRYIGINTGKLWLQSAGKKREKARFMGRIPRNKHRQVMTSISWKTERKS